MPTGRKSAPPSAKTVPSPGALRSLIGRWLGAKTSVRLMTAEEKNLNKEISAIVDAEGHEDDRGHVWLELDEPIEGVDTHGTLVKYGALQRQKRTSVIMDEEVALDTLERLGITDRCTKSYLEVTDPALAIKALREAGLLDGRSGIEVVTAVDEEAVRVAYFEDQIPQADYDQIFTEKVTYALLPVAR